MWWNKNKENEKNVVKTTETRRVSQTQHSTRSLSVSTVYKETRIMEGLGSSSSCSALSEPSQHLLPNFKNSFTTDAKPININYQSPYRNSPVYKSFSSKTSVSPTLPQNETSSIKSYHPPLPATNQKFTSKNSGKIQVTKTGKLYDTNAAIPTYQTHSKSRGEVLIINNILFSDKNQRHGAKQDHKNLEILFKQMGFEVTVERDLKKSVMMHKVKNFSKKKALKLVDISVVIIMSHGTESKTHGGTEIFGIDDEGILVDELIECFNETDCKSMAGKPKIFIFQCCRGDNELFIQSDAQRTPNKKSALINALIAYSTLPGFVSHRDPVLGTWYIQTLCDVFSKHAHEYPIEDLLKMIDAQISSAYKDVKQITHYENRGFKKCYLHPV